MKPLPGRRRTRWWRYLGIGVLTIVLVLVGDLEFQHLINEPRLDASFSGAVTGNMTKLGRWQTFDNVCDISTVQGQREWTGQFVGSLNGDHFELDIAFDPFRGKGGYTDAGMPDAPTLATLPLPKAFGASQIHIQLGRLPGGAHAEHAWATEPDPSSRSQSISEVAALAGLGRASAYLNGDLRSGRLDATLMDSRAPGSQPVRISATFRCPPLATVVQSG